MDFETVVCEICGKPDSLILWQLSGEHIYTHEKCLPEYARKDYRDHTMFFGHALTRRRPRRRLKAKQ